MSEQVLIVGGGVIGLACAHYLCDAGFRVTVIDKSGIMQACSHGNCGYICPSHVLPLTEPGMVGEGVKSLFKPNAPFRVKPRWDPALWKWMWDFARRCNPQGMMTGARALKPILDSSMAEYRKLVERDDLSCEWNANGLLYVFATEQARDRFGVHVDDYLAEHFGVKADVISGEALETLDPALKPGLAGAYYYPDDATLRPDKLGRSWRASLESRGVQFVEHCEMRDPVVEGGSVRGVKTSQGTLEADRFVFTLGAWSTSWQKQLQCRIPIQPGKGYSLTMKRPRNCPAHSILFPETRVGVTPFEDAYRLGSMMEFSGYDTTIRPERIDLLRRGVDPYLREPYTEEVSEEWYGWRPMTPDSLPLIGPVSSVANAWLATGHNMIGLTLAPATGRLLAEMMSGVEPHIDPAPYDPNRFT